MVGFGPKRSPNISSRKVLYFILQALDTGTHAHACGARAPGSYTRFMVQVIDKALLWARQVLSAHAQLYIASLDGGSALKQGLGKSPLQLLLFSIIAHSAFKSKIKFKLQLFLL